MRLINKYAKQIPYLYFITIITYLFTYTNRNEGIIAYPILLLGIPFLWQLIKPSKKLNFALGITFVCISSYLILVYISNAFEIITLSNKIKQYASIGVLFIILNFIMSLWIVRNSLNRVY